MSSTHNFGAGSFTSELWIANKKIFPNLKSANVEFLTGGDWDWIIADTNGVVVKTVRHSAGGWASIDLPSLGLYGSHSIGFRNASPGIKKVRAGDLTYD